ncbi:hypothetical protein TIFTF001_031548 [Ficus carica]|uniref:Uncharacterized protein n=1 Tax=Ficus carica TaxID=3494 RepID=A0AA88DV68_FICCA|nr:hypothetical protein TIFTF001_031548 [Ficus carica]
MVREMASSGCIVEILISCGKSIRHGGSPSVCIVEILFSHGRRGMIVVTSSLSGSLCFLSLVSPLGSSLGFAGEIRNRILPNFIAHPSLMSDEMPEILRSPLTPSSKEVGIVVNGGTNAIVHRRSRRSDEISPMAVVACPAPDEDLVTLVIS